MSEILDFARKIARLQGYPYLENGLQPVEDYIVEGKRYAGLRSKYQEHLLSLREVWAEVELGKKTRLHLIRRAATVYYYAMQIEAQQPNLSAWGDALPVIRRYGIKEREAIAAALAIYTWRAEGVGNKDEPYELQLVQVALDELAEGKKPVGAPSKYGEKMMRLELRVPFSLRTALQRILVERRAQLQEQAVLSGEEYDELSLNMLIVTLLQEQEEVRRHTYSSLAEEY